ncbi:hypothetical protein CALVIDRAFT_529810 [Calocera viscosa TUFC12733]|uniref:DUF4218 domain-containing protein n=1 Tax=Calocera viscosa (strain TUFC12733) TaxID=1330018 RepID=A0A167IW72_CALVF|nr:hypothetical protein CALVIDRAFT_529810 [Calocera viscosa TUFC12733]
MPIDVNEFDLDDPEPDAGIPVDELGIPLSAAPTSGHLARATQEPLDSYLGVHANVAVRVICLLLLHMHARYQLPHLACAFLATALYEVLRFFWLLSPAAAYSKATAPPRTLNTIYKRLGLWDRFEVKTLCPVCWEFERFDDDQLDVDLIDELGLEDDVEQSGTGDDCQRYCPRCKESLIPGFEEDACESYLDRLTSPGVFSGIQDGSVWKDLKDPDSAAFFPRSRADAAHQQELRLGILVSMDWFDPSTSSVSESHSVGPLPVCIANLPPELRFRVSTYASSGFSRDRANPTQNSFNAFSGPSLMTSCACGRMGSSSRRPNVLEDAKCESPSSAWYATTPPYARCPASPTTDTPLARALSAKSVAKACSATDEWQKEFRHAMDSCTSVALQECTTWGVNSPKPASERRIDTSRGLSKTQWYYVWVLGGKQGIKILREGTEAGRPAREGSWTRSTTSSRDSRCRDVYMLQSPPKIALIRSQIPPILLKASKEQLPKKRMKKRTAVVDAPAEEEEDLPAAEEDAQQETQTEDRENTRVHPAAARNYLKLATVIKIYLRREITDDDLDRASTLYKDFFEEFVEIYGAANVTPTFHWLVHMAAQIQRYGPVHGFWTFLFERLNKDLKGFQTNGHKGGVTEITFAREFKRKMSLGRINTILANQHKDRLAQVIAVELTKRARDIARTGTLAALAAEAQDDADAQIQAGTPKSCFASGIGSRRFLDDALHDELLSWYQRLHPELAIRHAGDRTALSSSRFMRNQTTFHPELIREGQRICPAAADKGNKSESLVLLRFQPGVNGLASCAKSSSTIKLDSLNL